MRIPMLSQVLRQRNVRISQQSQNDKHFVILQMFEKQMLRKLVNHLMVSKTQRSDQLKDRIQLDSQFSYHRDEY